jgi:hypothetical protein
LGRFASPQAWDEPVRLHKAADIVFVACCIALLAITLNNLKGRVWQPKAARTSVLSADRSYADYTRPGALQTVVLYLHPSCRYCTESMPFYRRLADLGRAQGSAMAVRFMSTVNLDELRRYLAAHALADVEVVSASPPPGITGTPSVFVLGRDGRVVASYTGVLSSSQERAFLRSLAR